MTDFSRRDVLSYGAALCASSALSRSAWARTAGLMMHDSSSAAHNPASAIAPREQLLFDFGWKFSLGNADDPARDMGLGMGQRDFAKQGFLVFARPEFDDSEWRTVNLPHDWAEELPFVNDAMTRGHGYKPLGMRFPETSVGWYRREFEIPASDLGRRIVLEFDGAFRDVMVFANGCYIARNDEGYTPFRFDLTDFIRYGQQNCIAVRVQASYGEGWFYEGAGIYRHLWLLKTGAVHLGRWDSTVRTALHENSGRLSLAAIVENQSSKSVSASVSWKILDGQGKQAATAKSVPQLVASFGSAVFSASALLANPALWSVDTPNLYSAVINVEAGGKLLDADRITFGVRSAVFDPERGLLLNGKEIKIQGMCVHQDHAGVGVALPDRLQSFRLAVLKEMGCNGVRTAHNQPTPEWVEACDRLGMMMMCETRQMSAGPEGMQQLETMVKRYRNSPSIIFWSIGNEENRLQTSMADVGERIATDMVDLCHKLDPTRPVSAAVNGLNDKGVSDPLDIIGFNYTLDAIDNFHKENPKRPIYGSETAGFGGGERGAYVSQRGGFFAGAGQNVGAGIHPPVLTGPGSGPMANWWVFYDSREWTGGGFAWTGIDYRGEPSGNWPSNSSTTGAIDLCGFPKDIFYYYKAWWTQQPVVHLFPHWNWAGLEGTEIPVSVYSNLDEVELFVNGKSMGSQKMQRLGHLEWKVKYEPGVIEAHGSKDGKVVLTDKRETTGPPAAIRLTADRIEINADGEDVSILTVETLDKDGRVDPTAKNKIRFKVSGDGAFVGVGNGDSDCQESDKEPARSLFSGLAQLIVQSTKNPGEIVVEAFTGDGGDALMPAKLVIKTKPTDARPSVPVESDSFS